MPTQERLKELLSYDPDTGLFTWLIYKCSRASAGDIAGGLSHLGYIRIGFDGRQYEAHRLAWLYVYGEWPSKQIDHINHDRADNRIKNLRVVSAQENQMNTNLSSANKSGVTGVFLDKKHNSWLARIKVNKKQIHLGSFRCFDEAVVARKGAEKIYGFHENHGKPL